MSLASVAERVWRDDAFWCASARRALAPLAGVFGAVVALRNGRFDRGVGVHQVSLPALSVGNLTVGGTGKTPVASWCVRALQAAGARPAIVMRGYGDDEWRVHEALTPGVPVIRDADRVRGIDAARAAGADCVVLDDAFQHRRAARVADLVLMSADAWFGRSALLPAGPFREPLAALGRASAVLITSKAASPGQVEAVRCAVQAVAPHVPIAEVALQAEDLRAVAALDMASRPVVASAGAGAEGTHVPLATLAGRRVLAVSAIGDPAAFEAGLRVAGAHVEARRWPDHHAFTAHDVAEVLGATGPESLVVCTLKDAVKLARLWPRVGVPLWYVSQTIVVRAGAQALDGAVDRVLAARVASVAATSPTAG